MKKLSQRWSTNPEPLPGAGFGRGYNPPGTGWGNPISYEEILEFVDEVEDKITQFIEKHAKEKKDRKKMFDAIFDELTSDERFIVDIEVVK